MLPPMGYLDLNTIRERAEQIRRKARIVRDHSGQIRERTLTLQRHLYLT